MKHPSGFEILENQEGSGQAAELGDRITCNVRIFLNRGDEVPINETKSVQEMPADRIRRESGQVFIDHISRLGRRQAIAGIEKAIVSMRAGGFRKVRVSPHLVYGSHGLPGLVPPDAVLDISIWLRKVVAPNERPR